MSNDLRQQLDAAITEARPKNWSAGSLPRFAALVELRGRLDEIEAGTYHCAECRHDRRMEIGARMRRLLEEGG